MLKQEIRKFEDCAKLLKSTEIPLFTSLILICPINTRIPKCVWFDKKIEYVIQIIDDFRTEHI